MSIDHGELALGIVISAIVVAVLFIFLETFEESMPLGSPARQIVENGQEGLVVASSMDMSDYIELLGIVIAFGVGLIVIFRR